MTFKSIYAAIIPHEPYLKIGITGDPKRRLQNLQTSCSGKIQFEILLKRIPSPVGRLVDDAVKRILQEFHVTGEGGGTEFFDIRLEELRQFRSTLKLVRNRITRRYEKQTSFDFPVKNRRQIKRAPSRVRSKPREWWKV